MRNDPETTRRLELRALEMMVRALCTHTEQLAGTARARGALDTREAELQAHAFDERRDEAQKLLAASVGETALMRIARLERLVESLQCSREYFLGLDAAAPEARRATR